MKSVLLAITVALVSSCVGAITPAKTTAKPSTTATAPQVGSKASAILKEEDCDDKAKKPVEIKPESISLSGGDAGCSLDELTKKP